MSARLTAAVLTIGLLGLAGCTTSAPASGPAASSAPAARPGPATTTGVGPTGRALSPSPQASPTTQSPSTTTTRTRPTARTTPTTSEVAEPTTTNTLPPPARPSRPAPSTSGKLSARSLPVPVGWKTVVRPGSSEEGYQGNGTWVHARDPRYAARDAITLGCRLVTRDDYPDPESALEGSYARGRGGSGIGLVLQFPGDRQARAYYDVYVSQVRACTHGDGPVTTRLIRSDLGLIDRRTYPDGDWTEVGALRGSRVTLIILTDPGHRISTARSERLLRQVQSR